MMHKPHLALFALCLAIGIGCAIPLEAVNVRDFGAVGDGVADDTAALQAALNQCATEQTFCLAGHSWLPEWGGHGGHGGGGELFLPAGTYRITRPLVYPERRVTLRGEEGAAIVAAPEHDILYCGNAFRIVIEHLRLVGGRIQLNFFTNNNDMTMLRLEDCVFEDAALENIRAYNLKAMGEWRGVPPYLVDWSSPDRPTLAMNPEAETTTAYLPNSTLLAIADCRFAGANTFLNGGADLLVIEDTAFERAGGSVPPFLVTTNLNLNRVTARFAGTAEEVAAARAWFVSTSYAAFVENCDFANADGCVLPFFDSSSKPGYHDNILRIANSRFDLQGAPLVRFQAGTFSGILAVEGNVNLFATPSKAVDFEKIPTLEEIETKIRYQPYNELPLATQLKWRVTGNSGFDETLPEVFAPFREEPLPAAEVAAATVPQLREPQDWPTPQNFAGKVIRPDFDDGASADEALQRAFDQAVSGDRIILPGRRLDIKQALRVPADVEITAEGTALLWATEPELPCFLLAEQPGRLLLRNLAFYGGDVAVNYAAANGTALFQNCAFLDQRVTAIYAKNHPAKILVTDSVFFTGGGLDTNADHAEIRRNWLCNSPQMDEKGFFAGANGEMLAEYNLFVPILPRVNIGTFQPLDEYHNLPCGNNLRWFDCRNAKLHLTANRLGGEFNGMTPAYLFGEQSTLLVEGAYCWFGNAYTRKCMVYCHDLPKAILLRDIVLNGESRLPNVPYNITVRDPRTDADLPAQILPCAKASCISMYQ